VSAFFRFDSKLDTEYEVMLEMRREQAALWNLCEVRAMHPLLPLISSHPQAMAGIDQRACAIWLYVRFTT
jgi:hypothetical protein